MWHVVCLRWELVALLTSNHEYESETHNRTGATRDEGECQSQLRRAWNVSPIRTLQTGSGCIIRSRDLPVHIVRQSTVPSLMKSILQDLLKLQVLEFGEALDKKAEAQVAELRGKIPQPFLGHYDRLRARDKKGVAVVRNQVCSGCHMRVPIGQISMLMRGEDVQICETCGRYLCLPDPTEAEVPAPVEAAKPAKKPAAKPRTRRAVAQAT